MFLDFKLLEAFYKAFNCNGAVNVTEDESDCSGLQTLYVTSHVTKHVRLVAWKWENKLQEFVENAAFFY